MSYRVEITERAERAAREIVLWIAGYSPEKATDWYFDFLEAAESLVLFPLVVRSFQRAKGCQFFDTFFSESTGLFSVLRMNPFTLFTYDTKNKNLSIGQIFKAGGCSYSSSSRNFSKSEKPSSVVGHFSSGDQFTQQPDFPYAGFVKASLLCAGFCLAVLYRCIRRNQSSQFNFPAVFEFP